VIFKSPVESCQFYEIFDCAGKSYLVFFPFHHEVEKMANFVCDSS